MLSVEGLRKSYGERRVIRDVSFRAQEHGVYGLLGPNGAGKSTTMNMITGYLAPDAGDIRIDDISMTREAGRAKRRIGYLPEQPPLYLDMTVEEYLSYVAELKGIKRGEAASEVGRVLSLLDLRYVRKRLNRQLSKGYKQRVGLAQAILSDPPVIILDEPSSGLDPQQSVEMRELILRLGEEHTVLLSTHILTEITAVCGHVLILANGRLVADDTPEALLREENERQLLRLVLRGNASAAERSLSRIGGIESHRVIAEEAESSTIEITACPGADVREEVSAASIRDGYVILELYRRQLSLEEVYLRLTQEASEERDESGI